MPGFLAFHDVSFSYDSLGGDLFAGLTVSFSVGWTGIVGANGSGKTTLLRLAAGEILPAREAQLIVMDEPANHLDLPSIQCLEEALLPCPCGLLMVSHDLVFLGRLTATRWDIRPDPQSVNRSRLWTNAGW